MKKPRARAHINLAAIIGAGARLEDKPNTAGLTPQERGRILADYWLREIRKNIERLE